MNERSRRLFLLLFDPRINLSTIAKMKRDTARRSGGGVISAANLVESQALSGESVDAQGKDQGAYIKKLSLASGLPVHLHRC